MFSDVLFGGVKAGGPVAPFCACVFVCVTLFLIGCEIQSAGAIDQGARDSPEKRRHLLLGLIVNISKFSAKAASSAGLPVSPHLDTPPHEILALPLAVLL